MKTFLSSAASLVHRGGLDIEDKGVVVEPILVSLCLHAGDGLAPTVGANYEADATDKDFIRMAIRCAAA